MTDQALRRAKQAATPPPVGGILTRATVLRWSTAAGFAISLAGTEVTSFDVLELSFIPNPGDVVSVLRFKTTLLVLGIVESPGDQDVAATSGPTVTAASLTVLASDTVPGNAAVTGAVYEFEAWGNGTQTPGNRQTLSLSVLFGGNTMSGFTFGTTAFSTADAAFRWNAKVRVVCQSPGALGQWTSFIEATVSDFSGNIAPGNGNACTGNSSENTGSSTVDTTAPSTLALRAAWGSTSGSPSITTQVRLPVRRLA